jgi:hypothetical protein
MKVCRIQERHSRIRVGLGSLTSHLEKDLVLARFLSVQHMHQVLLWQIILFISLFLWTPVNSCIRLRISTRWPINRGQGYAKICLKAFLAGLVLPGF